MKTLMIVTSIVLILTLFLGICASEPIVIARSDLPFRYLDAIKSQSAGVYSQRMPLIPVYVSVGSFSEESVHYTIPYFPFGTVGMSYSVRDGYIMEKHLIHS